MHKLSVTMASKKETCKKKNYSEAEIDVPLMEEQMRAKTLFKSLSGGVMAKAKYVAWEKTRLRSTSGRTCGTSSTRSRIGASSAITSFLFSFTKGDRKSTRLNSSHTCI